MSTIPPGAFSWEEKNMVLHGSSTAGTSPALPGLTTTNVNLTVTFTNGVPSAMKVSISGYAINSIFPTSTLTNKPQITYAYQGLCQPICRTSAKPPPLLQARDIPPPPPPC